MCKTWKAAALAFGLGWSGVGAVSGGPLVCHGLTKYEHRKAKMEWDLAWFDRFLGSASDETESKPATH